MNYFLELLRRQARIQLAEQIVGGALITVCAHRIPGHRFSRGRDPGGIRHPLPRD
jgi:hypothetical protein